MAFHGIFNSTTLTTSFFNQTYCNYLNNLPFMNNHRRRGTSPLTMTCNVEGGSQQHDRRRSGNYEPGMWGVVTSARDHHHLDGIYDGHVSDNGRCGSVVVMRKIEELKKYVKEKLLESHEVVERMELIDLVQRLGLGCHFEKEIRDALVEIRDDVDGMSSDWDEVHACALRFRLLRQAGLLVSQDVFKKFRGANGEFNPQVAMDVKGLLGLYEASHLRVHGEEIMDDAKAFALRHLSEDDDKVDYSTLLGKQVEHALQLPLYWRMQRAEANWFIELYREMEQDIIILPLLQLAKLDFNMVQQVHRNELEELTSWWKDLGLKEEMEFARDPLVESFLWAIGMTSHPQMGECRIAMAKVAILVHIIDDVYDVYGFLDELELFTMAIDRWDISELDKLPHYMQLCFMAVYNTGNQMSNHFNSRQQGRIDMMSTNQWADLCRSYLKEARSYRSGSDQTLDQYLDIAWKSVACDVVLIHGYLSSPTETLTHEALDVLTRSDPNLTRLTSIIVRLTNDLASSKGELERGDVVKAVECYMKEKKVSEDVARGHMDRLIDDTWKMINDDVLFTANSNGSCDLPTTYVDLAINVARTSHYMYKHGVSKGSSSAPRDKDRAVSLLFEPL
ncbi:Alpha-terpineol synthase, chloroplastic [Linum perenne]